MRVVHNIKLFKFHELSDKGKKAALQAERKAQQSAIQEMIEALFEQELARVGAVLSNLTIDWEKGTVMADVQAKQGNTEKVEVVITETIETAQEELPMFLSDAYMQANIEADELEFLSTGKVWAYREDEL